jgi:hypothetical protein
MKKRSSLIMVYLGSMFLVLSIVVSVSFSASVGEGESGSQNSGIQKTPVIKDSKAQKAPTLAAESIHPKQYFWELVADYGTVNGKPIQRGKEYKFYIKPGDTLKCKFYYKMKTPSIKNITKADTNFWGTGGFTSTNIANIKHIQTNKEYNEKIIGQRTPKFTYEDVKKWKKTMKGGAQKTWTKTFNYNWTPRKMRTTKTPFFLQFMLNAPGKLMEFYQADNALCLMTQNFGEAKVEIYVTTDPPVSLKRDNKSNAPRKSINNTLRTK